MKPKLDNPFAARQYGQLEQVSERVFIFRNIVNSSIYVGDKGLAVVDTQVNHALARRLRDLLQKTFAKPILYAINTHYHWDHTNGNPVFKEAGAQLVGNKDTADFMVSKAPRQKDFLASRGFELGPDPILHDIFIEDQHRFDLGNLILECHRGHSAETDDPTLIHCPQEGVLTSGDTVMTGSFPIFGQPVQREGLENDNWLTAIDEVRSFQCAHILPGHGPVADSLALNTLENICRYFLDHTREAHDKGMELNQAIHFIESHLPAWITSIPEVWGTPRYAILRVWAGLCDLEQAGWQHVKPSTIPENKHAAAETAKKCSDEHAFLEAAAQSKEGGDIGQSISLLQTAHAQYPTNPQILTVLGEYLIDASKGISSVLEKGDCFNEARRCWQQALNIEPDFADALMADAQFLVMMSFRNGDDTDKGQQRLHQAAAAGANPAKILFYQGIIERSKGNESGATLQFREALQADPSFMPARLAMME